MENPSVLDDSNISNNNNSGISLTDSQQFQSKYVESSYDDSSSTSSIEEIDQLDELIELRVNSRNTNNNSGGISNINGDSPISIKVQDCSDQTQIQIGDSNHHLSSSTSSKTKLVRNPITLVEEYHSSSSLSSYTHSNNSSVSQENIFAAIKDIEESMNLFSSVNNNNSANNDLIDQQERPGRKLSISASSIPLPIQQSTSTVSPLSLSCSAPSLPGVAHQSSIITTTTTQLVSSSSQEKEIILIQSQPNNTITTPEILKQQQITTSKHTPRTKTIFHLSKLRKKNRENNTSNNNNNNNSNDTSNDSISPSTSNSSNLSTLSSSSSSSSNNDKKERKEKKRSWRLRLKHEKQQQEQKEDEKENNNKIESDKEGNSDNVSPNIKPISNNPNTTTTTTTTTTTETSTTTTVNNLNLKDSEETNNNSNNNKSTVNNNNSYHLPPFLSTSLPQFSGQSLAGLVGGDFDGSIDDDEDLPKGGRGRSNAFYIKPIMVETNGEFKISLPKPPSLPNLVQLSIPSILPKDSFSILSKPLSIFSKFKSKPLNSSQSSTPNPISSSSSNLHSHNNTSSSNSSQTGNSGTSTSTTTSNSNNQILNLINKVVKSNSSRFTIGFADTIGRRPNMEDESVIYGTYRGKHDEDYIALFDGHGGTEASHSASIEFHKILVEKLKVNGGNPVKSLKESFTSMNQILTDKNIRGGTTAVVALFLGKNGYIANVGDSRAVLCSDGNAIRVSLDHKPNLPKEEERIRQLGGTVITTTNSAGVSTSRVNGQLAVSRALGDGFLQPYVSCEPDIHGPISLDSKSKNQFLIIACDGLWDVMSDEEAVEMVIPLINDPETACIKLREQAYNRGSTDNISILVIKFSPNYINN